MRANDVEVGLFYDSGVHDGLQNLLPQQHRSVGKNWMQCRCLMGRGCSNKTQPFFCCLRPRVSATVGGSSFPARGTRILRGMNGICLLHLLVVVVNLRPRFMFVVAVLASAAAPFVSP